MKKQLYLSIITAIITTALVAVLQLQVLLTGHMSLLM